MDHLAEFFREVILRHEYASSDFFCKTSASLAIDTQNDIPFTFTPKTKVWVENSRTKPVGINGLPTIFHTNFGCLSVESLTWRLAEAVNKVKCDKSEGEELTNTFLAER